MPRNYIKKGGHGGARPGAGRKPAGDRIAQRYRERYTILPLDHMLSYINDTDPITGQRFTAENRPPRRLVHALVIAAAPFLHRRLAPIRVEERKPPTSIDLNKLNDDELAQLERIIMKAQFPAD